MAASKVARARERKEKLGPLMRKEVPRRRSSLRRRLQVWGHLILSLSLWVMHLPWMS